MAQYPLLGGCACGGVRYRLLGPPLSVQHCHCQTCRKMSGEFTSTGAVVRKTDIDIVSGDTLKSFRTSLSFERRFCSGCGCCLFAYEDSEDELMYFAPATLDGGVHPGHDPASESHIYVRSKAEWEVIGDGLPQHPTVSPDEIITDLQRREGG